MRHDPRQARSSRELRSWQRELRELYGLFKGSRRSMVAVVFSESDGSAAAPVSGEVGSVAELVASMAKEEALVPLTQPPTHHQLMASAAATASLSLLAPPHSQSLSSQHNISTSARFIVRNAPSHHLRTTYTPSFTIKAFSAPTLTQDDLKKLAADKAVEYVRSGMVLGLGTGSTAAFVVAKLGDLLSSGELTNIVGVPTSKRTFEQANSLKIPLATLDTHPHIDLAIDGADEVDPNLDLVKGRGGALLREKMVEAASDKFVVVVDDSKLVSGLGGSGLAMPVEVVQFCWKYNQVRLQELFKEEGCEAKLRLDGDGKPYVTDNANYIVDLYFKNPIKDSSAAGKEISAFEGVVEHGLFLDMTTAVIIAGKNGVEVQSK